MKNKNDLHSSAFISNDLLRFMTINKINTLDQLIVLDDSDIFELEGCTVFIALEIMGHRNKGN